MSSQDAFSSNAIDVRVVPCWDASNADFLLTLQTELRLPNIASADAAAGMTCNR